MTHFTAPSSRRSSTLTVVLFVLAGAVAAHAQGDREEVFTDGAADAYVFGGYLSSGPGAPEGEPSPRFGGWEVGGSVYPTKWVGVTGSFARTSRDDGYLLKESLAGVRVATAYGYMGARSFAHVLVGAVSVNGPGISDRGKAVVVGGGFDYLLVRLQIDYLRLDLDAPVFSTKNQARVFLGGLLPFCFRRCTWSAN